jgi:4-amino-4-deoxy-L-arabinose transferase-like glycosyltransferase
MSETRPLLIWALGIALGAAIVRLALLDLQPLTPPEAQTAWSQLLAARGWIGETAGLAAVPPLLGNAMALFFFLFGASDSAARLMPALAGVVGVLLPLLLAPIIGMRPAIAASIMLALSPILVEASRQANSAMITTALVLALVVCVARLATDRPSWAPWATAATAGAAFATDSSIVVALAAAGLSAIATWTVTREDLRTWVGRVRDPEWRPLIAFSLAIAVLAATGALMNLGGIGWALGSLWAGILEVVRPAPFPTRNLAAILAYELPLLPVALIGFVIENRAGNRLALFLGQWLLLLVALAAVAGQHVLALATLPVLPLALLAALAVGRLPADLSAYRLGGHSWGALVLTAAVAGAALMILAVTVGGNRSAAPITFIALAGLIGITLSVWIRDVPGAERWPSLALLGGLFAIAFSVGTIGRLSFGGSPPGMELLHYDETAREFREAFKELSLVASTDGRRTLAITPATPPVARWYGRDIVQVSADAGQAAQSIQLRTPSSPRDRGRTPFETISQLNRSDMSVLSILKWMVGRSALIVPQTRDIILAR